ncbi:hypothetical protein RZA67_05800 [Stenotrophomonas sp. C3(2023)]|uniref:hypothetical protein n=1 Tax=Stenotrophomonas sp. C3(2023) TaxID=3080277 RepID=UPI00293C9B27|nr:hypothetical protein [Stenotrophomonas sp. C3(2023)]MDV3468246.1 hypothetical protein [Stenotrophomonas sp. C3(2023)]
MNDATKNEEHDRQGVQESQQDRKQDDVAKQRPGQTDQQIDDTHNRRPPRGQTPR